MNPETYQIEYKILSSDVDQARKLRLSRLFTMLQEAAIAHTEQLGFGREKTLDRGFLWVVALQQLKLLRLPEYDERVILDSVPGQTMHSLYPRYSRLRTLRGETLLTASSIWTLMDQESRSMAVPEKTGVHIDGMAADWECFFPKAPKGPTEEAAEQWIVPYSVTDLNGHMNNARYLDLAVDRLPEELRRRSLRGIQAEFSAEIRFEERMELRWQAEENCFRLSGSRDRRIFRLCLEFEP